jgi:myo-inositol-1(or 4)-monophosphatase
MSDPDLALAERLARTATTAALAAGAGASVRKGLATDVVTEADRRAEEVMVALLQAERPADGIVGEEGTAVAGGRRRWLLDPVDGTLNFSLGVPVWCAAVALVDAAGPVVAAAHDPLRDELFSAARGGGARCNGSPLRPRPAPRLAEALVSTFVDVRHRDAEVTPATDRLTRAVGSLRSFGSGTLELAWVAAGRLHAWVQVDTEAWDWHPGALLVAEAGGIARVRERWHVAAAGAALADEIEALVGREAGRQLP